MAKPDYIRAYRDGILLGTQYYRAPTPTPAEWEDDLRIVKDLGLALIQLRPQWRWHERQAGKYQWDDLDRILDLAEKAGLKVMVKFMLETAPQYVFDRFDGYRYDLRGQRMHPRANSAFYPGGWMPCFDNPAVMQAARAFVTAAVKRYRDRDGIVIWHAWNEPRSRPMGECTCAHSRESYRRFLRERFGTVERLNDFAGKCWGAFDDLDAPRDTNDFAEMHLWRQWAAGRVAWRVGQVVQAIKTADRGTGFQPVQREVIAHVGFPSVLQDVLDDTSDDYLTRRSVDFYGSSFEPRWIGRPLEDSWQFLIPDWIRAVSGDGYFWINELYPSWGQWAPEFSPATIARWMWACLAGGAKGLVFWQFKKERLGWETNDAGLVETDGRANATTAAVRGVLAVVNRHSRLLRAAVVPRAKVAIVYDFASDLVSRLEDTRHNADYRFVRDMPGGYIYKAAVQGIYHLFWLAGVQVDLLSSHELERVKEYPLVYLPAMFIVDERQAAILTEYVAAGGRLVAEGGLAQRQANTWLQLVRPGAGMDELFGLRETARTVWNTLAAAVTLPISERRGGSCEPPRITLQTRLMQATFSLTASQALGAYAHGSPALAENAFGRGRALMTAFGPGISFLYTQEPGWADWACWLVGTWAHLPDQVPSGPSGLYVRLLEAPAPVDGRKSVYFIFNRGSHKLAWTLPSECRELGAWDLTSDVPCPPGRAVQIAPGGVAVVAL